MAGRHWETSSGEISWSETKTKAKTEGPGFAVKTEGQNSWNKRESQSEGQEVAFSRPQSTRSVGCPFEDPLCNPCKQNSSRPAWTVVGDLQSILQAGLLLSWGELRSLLGIR